MELRGGLEKEAKEKESKSRGDRDKESRGDLAQSWRDEPRVKGMYNKQYVALKPNYDLFQDSPLRAPPLAEQPAIAPTVSKMTEDLRAKVRAMLNN